MRKTNVTARAVLKDSFYHISVPEFPGVYGVCRSRQNIAKTVRDSISEFQGIPASRIQVTKVQVS